MSVYSKLTAIADAIRANTGGTELLTLDDMAVAISESSGGGFGLNIVDGLDRPTNPTQGMIWAKTEHKVTYYDLSATKPENPAEGTLWLNIGDSGTRKIVSPISKEWITVYAMFAQQYISGGWVEIETASYQGYEWVNWWNGELYKNGNEYTTVTGGWQAIENNTYFATVTKGTSAITLSAPGTAGYSGLCGIKNSTPIDLSKWNTLRIRITSVNSNGSVVFGIMNTYNFEGLTNFLSAIVASKECKSATTFDLDISSIDKGLPFVKVGSTYSVTFDLVLLE